MELILQENGNTKEAARFLLKDISNMFEAKRPGQFFWFVFLI